MIDTPTSDNWRDWVSRYVNTFGFFLNKNDGSTKPILVYVSAVNEQEATFTDSRGKSYSAYTDSGLMFKFIPVNRGFFRCNQGHLYYMERRPTRQWKRGICTANTRISRVFGATFKDISAHSYFGVLENIFVDPVPFKESRDNVDIRMSKQFAVSDGHVFFYRQYIGHYMQGSIELTQPVLEQEMIELASKFDIKVVN